MREGSPQLKGRRPSRPLWISHLPYTGRLPVWVFAGLAIVPLLFFCLAYRDLVAERAHLSGPALAQDLARTYSQKLPRPLSETVTLLSVQAEGMQLVLTHEIKPEALSVRDTPSRKAQMAAGLKADACASIAYQDLLADGLSLKLVFRDPSEVQVLSVGVSAESCKLAAREDAGH